MPDSSKNCPQCGATLPDGHAAALCPTCLLQVGFETQPAASESGSAYAPTFVAPTAEELTSRFPQLEILETIGHGGMGIVYKARQKELDRIVALKIIRPGISGNPTFAERFQREARALAKLNHPNVITVYDFGRQDDLFYFLMEYVDGTNLRHLQRSGSLTPQEALKIVPQVCAALQYAHDNGVVHRDIKPENILINKDGDVRIADFGLAKLAGLTDNEPLTGTWQVMGTPHYMAPEQFEKPTTVDHRADIYSLGVVIYELLTGELPLGRFPLPSKKAQLDVRLDEVVLRSLDKEPERRYQHVTEVATAVEEVASGQAAAAAVVSQLRGAKSWVAGAAARASKKAKSWKRTAGVKEVIRGLAAKLHGHRRMIGGLLMWLTASGVCLSVVLLPTPIRERYVFQTTLAVISGSIAFIFGRGLRRDTSQKWQRWAATLMLLPCLALPWLINIATIVLVVAGLLTFIHQSSETSETGPPPDALDRMSLRLRALKAVATRRRFFLTCAGLLGWTLIVGAYAAATFWFYIYPFGTSEHYVRDNSAMNVQPHSASYTLSIDFPAMETGVGLTDLRSGPVRNSMRINARSGRRSAELTFDFTKGNATLRQGKTILSESKGISRTSVSALLSCVVDDVEEEDVRNQIEHLKDVVGTMRSSRGISSRLSVEYTEWYLSTWPAVMSIIRERDDSDRSLRNRPFPVGRLFDRSLFYVEEQDTDISWYRQINFREASIFCLVFGGLWVIGLIRILRALFLFLWRPALRAGTTQQQVMEARTSWSNCCILLTLGTLTGTIAFLLASPLLLDIPVVGQAASIAAEVILWAAGLTILMTVLGQPFLRSFGQRCAALAGLSAMFPSPAGLVTFPTGFAAWLLLEQDALRQAFRGEPESADSLA